MIGNKVTDKAEQMHIQDRIARILASVSYLQRRDVPGGDISIAMYRKSIRQLNQRLNNG
jgi:hypothetical protein